MTCSAIREIDTFAALIRQGSQLNCTVIQGLDLRMNDINWESLQCDGATFLGCTFPEDLALQSLIDKGAIIFPKLKNLPYNTYRSQLYTREELNDGWLAEDDQSLDKRIYDHFDQKGRNSPDVLEAMAQRLHDHSIDDALTDLLEGRVEQNGRKKVVAIMGGHGTPRSDPYFRKVAQITRELTRKGYFIASGGGPGTMEAANLGAWMANAEDTLLDQSLDILAEAAIYTDEGYVEKANQVLEMHPHGSSSLAVPTWFYGHEPTNLFSRHVAKYFSNSIREDGLLAIAKHGVIFAPGSAGTTQEIFMDATQNHYVTFDTISPMIFLGVKRYQQDTMLFDCISQLAEGKEYAKWLSCTDDVEKVIEGIETFDRA
ncbi:MAG: LOG family protein [Akkermansiaceae bacterium]